MEFFVLRAMTCSPRRPANLWNNGHSHSRLYRTITMARFFVGTSEGMMHDECMVGIGGTPVHWYPTDRDVPVDAILHPSVYERLALPSVTTRRRNISKKT
jgi:hypothetical protein